MQDIKELTLEGIERFLISLGQQRFHAKQIWAWIYKKGVRDFAAMTDLPADLKKILQEKFYLFSLKLVGSAKSSDGTEKFIFLLRDKNFIEAVTIPSQKRLTVCVSTQAGCKFSCRFCASGLLGFKRNLSCAQILEQILYLKNNSKEKRLTHVVFMGTGEPLDNYTEVLKAIRIINSPLGLNLGARRLTISTCGVTPGIKKLAQEALQVELSISLHAADDKTRDKLMPVNKIYPLKDLITAAREYIRKTNRQITFEYCLIKGVNSDLQNAAKLSKILKGLNCKVNLIPVNPVRNTRAQPENNKISNGVNPVKECNVEPPNKLDTLLFRDYLLKAGINTTLRRARGEDIEAACGQLRLKYVKE